MQADAYAGFNRLDAPGRQPGPIVEAGCWAHARRKLYELAAVAQAPIAIEAVRRLDQLFAVERDITGLPAEARLAARVERSAPILAELEPWLRRQLERLSRKSEVGKAIAYTTKRWPTLTRFMQDGRSCMTNNAAERALRGVAVGPAQLDLRRLGSGRRAGRRDLHLDRDGQTERHQLPGLACRCARAIARPPGQTDRPAPAVELGRIEQGRRGRLLRCRQASTAAAATGRIPRSWLPGKSSARSSPASTSWPAIRRATTPSVDDPARFAKSRAVGPALGLTPSRYQSGEADRPGAITKAGDARARVTLFEAAHVMMTRVIRWFPLKAWAMRVAARRGAKRAKVALARPLAVILHRMWVDDTDFQAQPA